jgi:hypothetical protein
MTDQDSGNAAAAGVAAAARVDFPVAADGRRSTSALGRAVISDALRRTDPAGALGAEQETNWRSGYLTHFRRLIEAGLSSPDAALAIAADGLGSVHGRMRAVQGDGEEAGLDGLLTRPARHRFATATVQGTEQAEAELSLPYRGERLRGDDLARRLDAWVAAGIIEQSCADAVGTVAAHPEWLSLPGRTVAVLGAGSEIGPLPVLLRWGATVAGIDLAQRRIWERVLQAARASAGMLLVPVNSGEAGAGAEPGGETADRAGADLVTEVPELADWLAGLDGSLVLGNYVYADGAANVRVCSAADALTLRLQAARDDVALGFLATPTDVFAVPADAVAQSVRAYAGRPFAVKLASRPLRTLSGGRLLRRAYRPDADPGINDSLVAQQGPNYALAKRLQRWRASVARDRGSTVSLNVAPPTRTRSVVKNRALAAAYAGAHRFGAEVFEPDTCRVLMAALLVHDLNTGGGPVHAHPWQDEAYAAAHGGLWRIAYAPRSALGLAALLGYGAART